MLGCFLASRGVINAMAWSVAREHKIFNLDSKIYHLYLVRIFEGKFNQERGLKYSMRLRNWSKQEDSVAGILHTFMDLIFVR